MERSEAIEKLNSEFRQNISADAKNGMIDLKVFSRKNDEAVSMESIWTLNNALKISKSSGVRTYKSSEINAAISHFRP